MKKSDTKKITSPYIVKEIKKINKNKMSILDVGCGTGEYFSYFQGSITGVDYDPALLKIAKEKFPNVKYIRHDCKKLPLPLEKKFDLVFSTELVEHLSKNDAIRLMNALEKISRRYVFISTPNVNSFTALLRFVLFRSVAIAGRPNMIEKILYYLKYRKKAPMKNRYPVVDEHLLSDNPQKSLHYHVSSFNCTYFKNRGYKVIGGLGFVSYNAIKNKRLKNFLNILFYYFPGLAGDILAIKEIK